MLKIFDKISRSIVFFFKLENTVAKNFEAAVVRTINGRTQPRLARKIQNPVTEPSILLKL